MIRRIFLVALICAASASLVRSQEPADVLALSSMNFAFMSAPIAFDTEPVAGAPYSAEAVTDMVQTLADGNRIVRQSKAQISRDSRGRTRREQVMSAFGGNSQEGPKHVQISDPESKTTIMLDLENKIAFRMPAPFLRGGHTITARGPAPGGANAEHGAVVNVQKFEMAVPAPGQAGVPAPAPEGATAGTRVFSWRSVESRENAPKPIVEELGVQFIEGVTAEGTRTTLTIPAGQIGNEQPINIVSERWTSPELKVIVMSRQSDPRFGETTYRLTNISRIEPAPELFEIPDGFTVREPMMREPPANK